MPSPAVCARWLVALCCVLAWPVSPLSAQDGAWSVEKLNGFKDRWGDLVDVPVRIEGRLATQGKGVLRLVKSSLAFQVTDEQLRNIVSARAVEVSGRVQKDRNTGKYVFEVSQLKTIPTDLEHVRTREAALKNPKPEDLYSLADWIAPRARFYNDQPLAEAMLAINQRGIDLEYRDLAGDSAGPLMALADKAEKRGLSKSRVQELRHESCVVEWQRLKQSPGETAAIQTLIGRVSRLFPGCERPVDVAVPALQQQYFADPLGLYRVADAEQRPRLQRWLYAALDLMLIESGAFADGRNGQQIAAEIEARVPELATRAADYRKKFDDFRIERAAKSTRQEVVDLANEFRQRSEPDRARQVLEAWLAGKEEPWRRDGAAGLVNLAQEYRQLLSRNDRAKDLLLEAWRMQPDLTAVTDGLNAIGYVLKDNQWQPMKQVMEEPIAAVEASPFGAAISEGRVEVGMTSQDLTRALGRPDSISRLLTGRGRTEVWSYGQRGRNRIGVRLEQTERAELKVVAVQSGR